MRRLSRRCLAATFGAGVAAVASPGTAAAGAPTGANVTGAPRVGGPSAAPLLTPAARVSARGYQAAYGTRLRSHADVKRTYLGRLDDRELQALRAADGAAFVSRAVPLLEAVEDRLASWKLQKWEFRLPPLLSPSVKEQTLRTLKGLQKSILGRIARRDAAAQDVRLVASITGLPEREVQLKTRAWLQDTVTSLRWKGEVEKARALRAAWLRLEETFAHPHVELLERCCGVYALARLGTFDSAFTNLVVERGGELDSASAAGNKDGNGATGSTAGGADDGASAAEAALARKRAKMGIATGAGGATAVPTMARSASRAGGRHTMPTVSRCAGTPTSACGVMR